MYVNKNFLPPYWLLKCCRSSHYFESFAAKVERLQGSWRSGSTWMPFLFLRSKMARDYNYWSDLWHLTRIWPFLSLDFYCDVKHLPCKMKTWTDFTQRHMQNWSPYSMVIWRPCAWCNRRVPSFTLLTETTWVMLLIHLSYIPMAFSLDLYPLIYPYMSVSLISVKRTLLRKYFASLINSELPGQQLKHSTIWPNLPVSFLSHYPPVCLHWNKSLPWLDFWYYVNCLLTCACPVPFAWNGLLHPTYLLKPHISHSPLNSSSITHDLLSFRTLEITYCSISEFPNLKGVCKLSSYLIL